VIEDRDYRFVFIGDPPVYVHHRRHVLRWQESREEESPGGLAICPRITPNALRNPLFLSIREFREK